MQGRGSVAMDGGELGQNSGAGRAAVAPARQCAFHSAARAVDWPLFDH